MKKTNIFLTLLTAMTLSVTGSLYAQYGGCYGDCYDPCYDSCSDYDSCVGGFYIGADFLYWESCLDDLEYAFTSNSDFTEIFPNGTGKYSYVTHEWDPGYRVRLGFNNLCDCWGLHGSYSRMEGNSSSSVLQGEEGQEGTGPLFILSTLTHSGVGVPIEEISAMHEYLYETFDVLVGYDYCIGECQRLNPFFGVEGMKYEQDLTSPFTAVNGLNNGVVTWESDYKGIGLKVGAEYGYRMGRCFELFGKASGTVLVGDLDSSIQFQRGPDVEEDPIDVTYNTDECLFVPGYHVGTGIRYNTESCGMTFSAQVGYEFVVWHNMAKPRRFIGDGSATAMSTSPSGGHLGFHGLFIGADIGF